ncbi:MAG: COG3014 family protein [Hyphomicrobiales bacterium]
MIKRYYSISLVLFSLFFLSLSGCATYYQKNKKYQSLVSQGKFDKARTHLEKDTRAKEGKNKILYYLNEGWVKYMTQDYDGSIKSFETANNLIADYQKNYALGALSYLINPKVIPYQANDVENVMVNYYKALDFMLTNRYQEALVEAKQITNKLYTINDKYKKYKNHYSDDAFAHIMVGLLYDANNDYNNAFIAYRNALKVYKEVYSNNFGIDAPEQLKKDILRTAYLTGFRDEVRRYEQEFNMKYNHKDHDGGYIVFLWENGFGPIKDEWSINFSIIRGTGGIVTFENEELGLSFPFPATGSGNDDFSDLEFIRVAFPKYVERKPVLTDAYCEINGKKYTLELAEDINAIEFKTLNDQMLRTLANSLLRLAAKKAIEYTARNENENIGAALGIVNAITEQADTRNWQTLPHSIYYTRIPVPAGENQIDFKANGHMGSTQDSFIINVGKGQTKFFDYRSLESNSAY